MGITQGAEEFAASQNHIETGFKELGYPPENRRFSPHLTLGGVKHSSLELAELSQVIKPLAVHPAGTTAVDEVAVSWSGLSREGPVYQALSHASLACPSTRR